MMAAKLTCDHRGERAGETTSQRGDSVPLYHCGHFGGLCSVALDVEGIRLCKTCPVKTSENPRKVQVEHQAEPGLVIRVQKQNCRKKCQWAWVVLMGGVVVAGGNEETEEEAHAEAQEESRAYQSSHDP